MSYHILHVLQSNSFLRKERGFLICECESAEVGRIALEDVRAVVVAARGVAFSAAVLSALLENDAILLHCNERFQPVGWTLPLARAIDCTITMNQADRPNRLNDKLWQAILRAKICNQSETLKAIGAPSKRLENMLGKKCFHLDEGHCAREYWKRYFPAIGAYGAIRDQKDGDSQPNVFLNYGYAVLATLVHRAILIHGLSPLLGVYHKTYYRKNPLVYDLMEPFRAYVDLLMAQYLQQAIIPTLGEWAKYIGQNLRLFRIARYNGSVKLLDAMDTTAASLANCYRARTAGVLWLPYLNRDRNETSTKAKSVSHGLVSSHV